MHAKRRSVIVMFCFYSLLLDSKDSNVFLSSIAVVNDKPDTFVVAIGSHETETRSGIAVDCMYSILHSLSDSQWQYSEGHFGSSVNHSHALLFC